MHIKKNKIILKAPSVVNSILTAHNTAFAGSIAEIIIISSSIKRVESIKNMMYDIYEFNNIRGALGYTGFYKNKRISVMQIGMGMPSHSIYLTGLLYGHGCKYIIKSDSCRGILKSMNAGEIIIGTSSTTQKPMQDLCKGEETYYANEDLIKISKEVETDKKTYYGSGYASVYFELESIKDDTSALFNKKYALDSDQLLENNIISIEMENYIVYKMAHDAGAKAISICSIAYVYQGNKNDFQPGYMRESEVYSISKYTLDIAACIYI